MGGGVAGTAARLTAHVLAQTGGGDPILDTAWGKGAVGLTALGLLGLVLRSFYRKDSGWYALAAERAADAKAARADAHEAREEASRARTAASAAEGRAARAEAIAEAAQRATVLCEQQSAELLEEVARLRTELARLTGGPRP